MQIPLMATSIKWRR